MRAQYLVLGSVRPDPRQVPEEPLSAATLVDLRSEVQVVDVRWTSEWEAGHIDGAVHIPLIDLDEHLGELQGQLVLVCRDGARAASAEAVLGAVGIGARSLDGGLLAWVDAGLALTTPDGRPGVVGPWEPPGDFAQQAARKTLAARPEPYRLMAMVGAESGDREPSEDEFRVALIARLVSEGRSPEQAQQYVEQMEANG